MTDMAPYHTPKDEDIKLEEDSEDSDVDDWDLPCNFNKPRHIEPIKASERVEHSWRVKEKYKTHCVALVLCLNVGVDPPDLVKTQPCARLECWIDPHSMSPNKALESIGNALQAQYERWQPRARYKQSLDPCIDEVKKLCCSLRRNAKDERVLFHYNGHGVPKPTPQGEIWVFNRVYTQYIPLSMYDLQAWLGAPSLYVYDCSNAGVIIDQFRVFADQHARDAELQQGKPPAASFHNCIQLAACAAGQSLPQHPELPADLFTACLTTPVKCAVRWFVLRTRNKSTPDNLLELIDKIPGQVTDRRTMLGELNWMFTAITDTIAWSSLPAELFQQLFRADLLTASLCRNFLLAERIMRCYNCTPVSSPALPALGAHPLWGAWEQTLDVALAQLPALLAERAPPYQHSRFFRDQLTAFRVWLDLGKWSPARGPPDQLPMVLQVLLSTLHRVRALQLLERFVRLGAWAVRAVLDVGVFPYLLRLLQAPQPSAELRASMVAIWARVVRLAPSCQVDLVNAKGHKYFLAILQDPTVDIEHRTMAAYVLAAIVDNYPAGQEAALQGSMLSICLEQLSTAGSEPAGAALATWAALGLGRLWRRYSAARWAGVRDLAHEKLAALQRHPCAQVRAACAFALGTFMAVGGTRSEQANALDQQVGAELAARLAYDIAPLARLELLAALQWVVLIFEQHFIAVYTQKRARRSDRERVRGGRDRDRVDTGLDALLTAGGGAGHRHSAAPALPAIGFGSVYTRIWNTLQEMSKEPHPQVAQCAADLLAHVARQVDSALASAEEPRPCVGGAAGGVACAGGVAGAGGGGSASLPPSPNTRAAPIHDHTRTLPAMGARRGKGLPHAASEDGARADRDSTSSNSSQSMKKPIIHTEFVEWAAARFGEEPEGEGEGGVDCESRLHHERVWRFRRNTSMRREARALRSLAAPLDTQAFHSRCPLPPSVVLFHPYEQQLAVASKDNWGIWDWGTGAKLCAGAWRRAWGRVTSLQYIDAHHRALLAVAAHSGTVCVCRPSGSSSEPALVSAWRALSVRPAAPYRPPPAQPLYSLAQLVTEQFSSAEDRAPPARPDPCLSGGAMSPGALAAPPAVLARWSARRQALCVGGAASALRVWDLRQEMLQADYDTESSGNVTALSWRGWLLACGLSDGGVRLWDVRAPPRAALPRPAPHRAPVLCAALRPRALVTAWSRRRHNPRVRPARPCHAPREPRGRSAGRGCCAPAGRRCGVRLCEPVDQHNGLAREHSQHHQVPRGLHHGRAHRARLLPRLPSAQARVGRWLQRLHSVGVRVGTAPVTRAAPDLKGNKQYKDGTKATHSLYRE